MLKYLKAIRIRIHYYICAKRFMKGMNNFHEYIMQEGNITTQSECTRVCQNITKDYDNRENSLEFIIEVMDYIKVYENPDIYKGNKQLEIRCGIIKAIYVLLLIALDELENTLNEEDED